MRREGLQKVACSWVAAAALIFAPVLPAVLPVLAPGPAYALTDEQAIIDEAWRVVNQAYVDRTFSGQDWRAVRLNAVKKQYKTKAEAYQGVRTMLATLGDKFTRFLTPAEYDSLAGLARGDVAGIGVELATASDKTPIIADVVPNGPAERAGLQAGAPLLYVDGQPVAGLALDEVAALLRGPVGSLVRVEAGPVAGSSSGGSGRSLKLTREDIKLRGVVSRVAELENGKRVGVITIKSFSKETADDVRAALESFKRSNVGALLLDLRHDPGGYFAGGIDTARLFLPADVAVVTAVDKNGIGDTFETIQAGVDTTSPLYVVIDPSTASAAEILAAALADNGRATLCGGPRTYGKAKVQNLSQLSDGSGIAVTVSKYLTPSGKDINGVGLPASEGCASVCAFPGDPTACVPPEAWTKR